MASQECRRLRRALMTGAGLTILATGGTFAQDLKFPIGEGGFTWDSYEEFAAAKPPRRDKPLDPDSPFAKLAALKDQMKK